MGDTLGGVYDVTVAYTGMPAGAAPHTTYSMLSFYVEGVFPAGIHYHVRYVPRDRVPLADKAAFQAWLYEQFYTKEDMLVRHAQTGRFEGAVVYDGPLHVPYFGASVLLIVSLYAALVGYLLLT